MPYRVKPKALTRGRTVVRASKRTEAAAEIRSAKRDPAGDWTDEKFFGTAFEASPASAAPSDDALFEASDLLEPDLFSEPHDTEESKTNTKPETTGRDSASDYLNRVMGPDAAGQKSRSRQQRSRGNGPSQATWATHRFGDALEIRTRQPLTREQQRQVRLAGELLKSILNSP